MHSALLFVLFWSFASGQEETSPLPTSPPPPIPQKKPCPCTRIDQIWIDVIVLFETGKAMTSAGAVEALSFVGTVFTQMTVDQSVEMHTRLGIITYSDTAETLRSLDYYGKNGTMDVSDDLFALFDGGTFYNGRDGTNIEAAIQLAQDQFLNATLHRSNAPQVIVIIGSDYKAGGYNSPVKAAEQFKEDGGILITICYVQQHGAANPMLRELASPGYGIDSQTTSLQTPDPVYQLFCSANCFCGFNMFPYTINGSQTHYCLYVGDGTASNQAFAKLFCKTAGISGTGTLVIEENAYKHLQVSNYARDALFTQGGPLRYWIGLEYNATRTRWLWPDGTSYSDYNNWANTPPTTDPGCANAVQTQGFNVQWEQSSCSNTMTPMCQESTCDTEHYCKDVPSASRNKIMRHRRRKFSQF